MTEPETLAASKPPTNRSAHASSRLVGRNQEINELNTALDHAISGHGQLVLVAGEPGIGKTSLADHLAELSA